MPNVLCLLFVLGHVVADVPSQRERLDLLGFLVRLRKDVSPPASNMNLPRYSSKMEKLAADWVSRCLFRLPHPEEYPQFNGTGIMVLSGFGPILEYTMGITFSYESRNYDYDSNACRGACRNYKLMVWAATTEIGCARHQCISNNGPLDFKSLLACVFNNA
uniref:SCP domain-containing protein n=1 Tax=Mesocestoides corti TaxID=53468 RepID=A0A5K3FEJ8_MESCO